MNGLPMPYAALVERAASRCPPDVRVSLRAQLATAQVTSEVPGRMLDVQVPGSVPSVPAPDGPLRPIPTVVDDGEATGELLVWVKGGRLVGLERPWWTDEAPTDWPSPDDLRFPDADTRRAGVE